MDQNTTIMSLQTTHIASLELKIADLEPFISNRLHLSNFLVKYHLKFAREPSRFKNELAKIYYTGSHLGEPVFSWFQPLLITAEDKEKPKPPEFVSFETFAKTLMAVYGDPNLAVSSVRAIKALKQTGSGVHYIAEFQHLRQYIPWNEDAFADQFYDGLKGTVKDDIARTAPPPHSHRTPEPRYSTWCPSLRTIPGEKARNSMQPKSTPMLKTPSQSSASSSLVPMPARTPSPSAALTAPAFTPDGTILMELDTYENQSERGILLPGFSGEKSPPTKTPKIWRVKCW
jgi:hypothetical protein